MTCKKSRPYPARAYTTLVVLVRLEVDRFPCWRGKGFPMERENISQSERETFCSRRIHFPVGRETVSQWKTKKHFPFGKVTIFKQEREPFPVGKKNIFKWERKTFPNTKGKSFTAEGGNFSQWEGETFLNAKGKHIPVR